MGRDVKIRDSYQGDAAYLTRLSRAVEKDPRRTADWKREVIEHLNSLTMMFLQDSQSHKL